MTKDQGDDVVDLLESRAGLLTVVRLVTGHSFTVHNVAAGRDIGADFYHFTTNISPEPEGQHTIDFFRADEVASITAGESGGVLFAV